MSAVRIRAPTSADADAWIRLRTELWPDGSEDHAPEVDAFFAVRPLREDCLVAEVDPDGVVGFAEVRLREYAEGCTTAPVGYLEGIYVAPEHRRSGVGRALVEAAERWALERGCSEMASDRAIANDVSGAFHASLGYEEVARVVCMRKPLREDGEP